MGYTFSQDGIYRMPTHFGPAPGPRQRFDGARWECRDTPRATTVWISFLTHSERLESHLPPGFELAEEAKVTIEARYLRDVEWLGGRGYNILGAYFDAVCLSGGEPIRGRLQAVVWESSPDAIISGREELGIPKLYAEIPDLDEADGLEAGRSVRCQAVWDGFTFIALEVENLTDADSASEEKPLPNLQYKYVPRTEEWGKADVAYAVMTPGETPNLRTVREFRGDGRVSIFPGDWQDLPTFVHIVDALAALPVVSLSGAGVRQTLGGKDLRDQRIIR